MAHRPESSEASRWRSARIVSLAMLAAASWLPAASGPCLAAPHAVFDPAIPGPDLPPRGRSLFDFLVTDVRGGKSVQAVPFPFDALLQRVTRDMRQESDTATSRAVLIPLGRSLQRMAAAPAFFAHPRAVVAITGEPARSDVTYLKDRLYLGYQEQANLIEVISYNEDAGRFEFQVVTDYRPGGTPRVAYANREMCTACHQNAAPIFSRAAWDETNANPRVAALLAARRATFYGIPVDRGVDVPNAIDDATLRANRFAADQLLWSEGCGGDDVAAPRCRAALFAAVLQFRLTGGQRSDLSSPAFRDDAAERLAATATQRWPDGLAVGNPDLPNRNPIDATGPGPAAALNPDRADLANVAPAFDPLQLRPSLEVVRIDDRGEMARLVAGLAGFLSDTDVERLDGELARRAARTGMTRRTFRAACHVRSSPATARATRLDFDCEPGRVERGPGVRVQGHVVWSEDAGAAGSIDSLELPGQAPLRDLDIAARGPVSPTPQRGAAFTLRRGRLHARGSDGNALESLDLRWNGGEGTSVLTVVDDFAPVRIAIAAMARDGEEGRFDGFGNAPFRRGRLMPSLWSGLGAVPGAWCCLDTAGLPPALATPIGVSSVPAPGHTAFHQYCGQCHQSVLPAPPNFLDGDAETIEAKLRQCAPRMYVRLAMWRSVSQVRAKTPMPPEVALRRFHLAEDAWRDGDALAGLLQSVAERIRAETGTGPQLESLLRDGYENLRPCLPAQTR